MLSAVSNSMMASLADSFSRQIRACGTGVRVGVGAGVGAGLN